MTITETRTGMTDPAPRRATISDGVLRRTIKWGALALALLLVAFSVVYYFGQHKDAGPSLTQRQVTAAEAAVRAQPANVGVRLALAETYRVANRQGDAIKQYNEVLKALPKNETALAGLASILYSQGNLSAAKTAYQNLITAGSSAQFAGADPMIQGARFFLGSIAFKQGDLTGAAGQLREALRLDPTDADSWYLTGQVALKQNAPASAATALEKAVSFVPSGWCDPYASLVTAYDQLKQPLQSTFAAARGSLCRGDSGAALTGFRTVAASGDKPLAVKAMIQLGTVTLASGDVTAATDWLNKVLKADPANAAAKAGLAQIAAANPAATSGGK